MRRSELDLPREKCWAAEEVDSLLDLVGWKSAGRTVSTSSYLMMVDYSCISLFLNSSY